MYAWWWSGVVSFYVCMVVEWNGEFLCMHGGGVEW